ncbi:hypothetical protein MRB53_040971 [Persea americana]|nr:hypothetical protein MRB53_040971 [Persea americana]
MGNNEGAQRSIAKRHSIYSSHRAVYKYDHERLARTHENTVSWKTRWMTFRGADHSGLLIVRDRFRRRTPSTASLLTSYTCGNRSRATTTLLALAINANGLHLKLSTDGSATRQGQSMHCDLDWSAQ